MCGIALAETKAQVEKMLELLEHRGKDHRGLVEVGPFYLGHNRLAIVDLECSGHQPLETLRGVLAFNGEIYNYARLYDALFKKPPVKNEIHVLEKIVRAHTQFWRMLDGPYAFVYVDKQKKTVMASRDMVGIIPLYYTREPLRIASEKKALEGKVEEFRAGETLWFDYGGRLLRRHVQDMYSMHMADLDLEHLHFLFRAAVLKRMVHSDRPVCVALSGGLDSAMVLTQAVQCGWRMGAITVAVDEESLEVRNARRLCEYLGVPHTVVVLKNEHVDGQKILWHLEDEKYNPIKWAAMIRNYFVAKHAPGVVILCGEGADEIGCGYPSHQTLHGIDLEWKALSTLRSMPAINLDRVNKGGMAWTKEYRVPFLDRALVLYLMGVKKEPGKKYFRQLAKEKLRVPDYILQKEKYSAEEEKLWALVESWQ